MNGFGTVKETDGFSLIKVLKCDFIAFVITLLIFLIVSLLVVYTGFSESYIGTFSVATIVLSLFISGFLVSKKIRRGGLAIGALTGFIYMMFIYFLTSIMFRDFSVSSYTFTMFGVGIVSCAFGGVLGINMKKKRR